MSVQQLREQLACALRWAARLDLHEGVDNHFSVAVPDDNGVVHGDRFLINPYGWHWSEITASSLVLCDDKGNVLDGDNTVETSAFCIHAPIHRLVPNATVVLHTHMPYATSLTLLEEGRLEMCEQNALMFDNRIAYDDDYTGLALEVAEGERLAAKIGNRSTLFLACHGVIVTGPSVADAFNDLYYLERAATFQVLARSSGRPLRTLSPSVRENCASQFAQDRPKLAARHFGALQRMLDKQEPDYRH